jgi:hypothetical protein
VQIYCHNLKIYHGSESGPWCNDVLASTFRRVWWAINQNGRRIGGYVATKGMQKERKAVLLTQGGYKNQEHSSPLYFEGWD